jgi:hypothetical protein
MGGGKEMISVLTYTEKNTYNASVSNPSAGFSERFLGSGSNRLI